MEGHSDRDARAGSRLTFMVLILVLMEGHSDSTPYKDLQIKQLAFLNCDILAILTKSLATTKLHQKNIQKRCCSTQTYSLFSYPKDSYFSSISQKKSTERLKEKCILFPQNQIKIKRRSS